MERSSRWCNVTGATGCYWLSTHWSLVTYICVSNSTIICLDNGLSPGRRQVTIWTNARMLLIWTLGTNFSEIISEINTFLFKKKHLKMWSAKWRPFCLGLNLLIYHRIKHNIEHNMEGRKLKLCSDYELKNTPHTSPVQWSYGASFLSSFEKSYQKLLMVHSIGPRNTEVLS